MEERNDLTLLLSGPARRSPIPHYPYGYADQSSTAILTSRPWLISSDGLDHFITVNVDSPTAPENFVLTLYQWGDTINTLDIQATYRIPFANDKSEFRISRLDATQKGLCYIILETWSLSSSGDSSKALREIVAVDIPKGTRQTIAKFEIDPPQSHPEGERSTSFVDICTIQGGKYLAVTQEDNVTVYQRL